MSGRGPSEVEARTQAWLDQTMDPGIAAVEAGLVYDADGRPRRMSRYHFGRLRRKLKIFRWLDRLAFSSFIDLASGWDHYPWLVRERYGVETYYSDMVHRMNLPIDGPLFGKLDHAVTLRLPRLPFPDAAFDVVLCSEVLEHLVRPVEAIAELLRITRRALILTSLEALSVNAWERWWSHHRVDTRAPHVERNFLLRAELEAIFGPAARHENLVFNPAEPASPYAPAREQEAAYARLNDVDALSAALCRAVAEPGHAAGAMGVLIVRPTDDAPLEPPRAADDAALTRWLIDRAAAEERQVQETLAIAAAWEQGLATIPKAAADALVHRPIAASLRERLVCPDCRGALAPDGLSLRCPACAHAFASQYGVPILVAAREPDAGAALDDAIARLCGGDAARARVVRRVAARLRRNERPPGVLKRAAWAIEDAVGARSGGDGATTTGPRRAAPP